MTFTASASGSNLFSLSLDAAKLSNRKVIMSYEPETVEDQQIIDSFGGLDNTPAYLVHLRPVLMLDGERMVVGQGGLPKGGDYLLDLDIVTPNGSERTSSGQIAGNMVAFGITAQKAVPQAAINDQDDAATILSREAIGYIDRWNQGEDELAALLKQSISRPTVSAVAVGGQVDVTWLMDTPQEMTWKGAFIDAGYRRIESVGRNGGERDFVQVSALEGSILENRIFEKDFGVESVSTAKLLQLANANETPLITIGSTNIDVILPTLSLDDAVTADIRNSVNQGLSVTIPQTETTYRDWTGIGYLKENLATGESGWMLTGMIAGGMTADAADAWVQRFLAATLSSPYSKSSNKDPLSAQRIVKIPVTDMQSATVGRATPQPLAVLVLDPTGLPVQGAQVVFMVVAGGGTFAVDGSPAEVVVTTGTSGTAKAPFLLGTKTADNAIYVADVKGANLTQVGLNVVAASVTGNYGTIRLPDHFQAYGWPDLPDHIEKGLGDGFTALANNPAGSVVARIADRYANPISNIPLMFEALLPTSSNPLVPLPASARNVRFYIPDTCSVAYPLYGDCATSAAATLMTQYYGAIVNTMLGNTVGTRYTVKVSAPAQFNLAPVFFALSSDGYRTNGDYIPPGLFIRNLEIVNDSGQRVSAAKVGKALAAPLVSELFMLSDDYTLTPAGNGAWNLSWSGTVTVKAVKDGSVSYTATAGGGSMTPT